MNALVNVDAAATLAGVRADVAQYLTFRLGNETFALDILHIREIIEFGQLTEVPMMPTFIRGVINLRGRVVPVVDLGARFGRGQTVAGRRSSIVILEIRQVTDADAENFALQEIGIMVDAVNEVIDIRADAIEPPPSFGVQLRPEFINGMARRDNGFIILLDVSRVLSIGEMSSLSAAYAA
jgi:purine-binding chemotaxis protein CheW